MGRRVPWVAAVGTAPPDPVSDGRRRPVGEPARRRQAASRAGGRDRKSTRLNSSHEWISYAVFCLKKKKLMGHEGGRMERGVSHMCSLYRETTPEMLARATAAVYVLFFF